MNEQILTWTKRPNCYVVKLIHENIYGTQLVTCILDRHTKLIPTSSLGRTEEDAIAHAKKLLDKLVTIDNVESPALADQPRNNGYTRKMYSNQKVEFKNIDGRFHVTDINEYDEDDYRILEDPIDIKDFAKDQHTFRPTGEISGQYDIYFYDNTFALAGDGGYVKVKDGKIHMKKSTFRS